MRSKNRKNRNRKSTHVSNIDKLIAKLNKKDMPLDEFLATLDSFKDTFYENAELEMELLLSNGLPIELEGENIFLKTNKTPFKRADFLYS